MWEVVKARTERLIDKKLLAARLDRLQDFLHGAQAAAQVALGGTQWDANAFTKWTIAAERMRGLEKLENLDSHLTSHRRLWLDLDHAEDTALLFVEMATLHLNTLAALVAAVPDHPLYEGYLLHIVGQYNTCCQEYRDHAVGLYLKLKEQRLGEIDPGKWPTDGRAGDPILERENWSEAKKAFIPPHFSPLGYPALYDNEGSLLRVGKRHHDTMFDLHYKNPLMNARFAFVDRVAGTYFYMYSPPGKGKKAVFV